MLYIVSSTTYKLLQRKRVFGPEWRSHRAKCRLQRDAPRVTSCLGISSINKKNEILFEAHISQLLHLNTVITICQTLDCPLLFLFLSNEFLSGWKCIVWLWTPREKKINFNNRFRMGLPFVFFDVKLQCWRAQLSWRCPFCQICISCSFSVRSCLWFSLRAQ